MTAEQIAELVILAVLATLAVVGIGWGAVHAIVGRALRLNPPPPPRVGPLADGDRSVSRRRVDE